MKQNRILVVDDEPNHLKTIQRIFNDSNHVLAFADNGKAAVALIPEFHPDLVIMDVMMPEMDGHQLCRHIKSDPNHRHMMTLMLSGLSAVSDRMAGYQAEADDYLTKPFDPEELIAKVEILLRLKNSQDHLQELNRSLEEMVRKRTRELMEKERQALVGRMVQGIVHNLRGPLAAAKGNTEVAELLTQQVLAAKELSDPQVLKTVSQISDLHAVVNRVIGQAGDLLSNLLAKSRNEAILERRTLNLNDVIREELKFLDADHVIGRPLNKKVSLVDDLPPILGNYSDFSQLIYNMVKNASDAMANSPLRELTISTGLDDNHVTMAFQDTGSGISPEHIDKVFELYFTTKPARANEAKMQPSGTGIGLYTCDQIVRSYGGEIRVVSQPGKGTLFTIRIPRENEVPATSHKRETDSG